MIALYLLATASAAPCTSSPPPLAERVQAAWAQYNDAEVPAAKAIVLEAYEELVCPQAVISSSELLDLYRLDGLVSVSQSDQKGAMYATLRAVAVDHTSGAPPEAYGPYLAELYETWASRMALAPLQVSVNGGGVVYVDGRPVVFGVPLSVAAGEHLIQIEAAGVFRNSVLDLGDDYVVSTGVALPPDAVQPAPVAAIEPEPEPEPVAEAPVVVEAPVEQVPEEPVADGRRARRRPVWAFAGAALAGGGAAFAVGSAVVSERNFVADPYAGLGSQREEVIRKDAQSIRLAYGVGYGLAAVSGGLLTVGIVGFRASASPAGLHFGGRF